MVGKIFFSSFLPICSMKISLLKTEKKNVFFNFIDESVLDDILLDSYFFSSYFKVSQKLMLASIKCSRIVIAVKLDYFNL